MSSADNGTREGILSWIEYVLKGLKEEIEKIDKLSDYEFLRKEILMPSIILSLERKYITDLEAKVLKRAVEKQVFPASDIKDVFPGKADSEVSRQIKKLIDQKMLTPEKESGRKYVLRLDNNYLLRKNNVNLGQKIV